MRQVPRQLLSLVLGVFVLAAAALGLAAPASAHDAAESTSPAQGAALAAPPAEVSVTFSNKPLGIGSTFSVKDAGGTEWSDGSVQIVDNVATQKLRPGGPAGTYTVAWRVVSSDSHPIAVTCTLSAASGTAAPGAPSGGSRTAAGRVPCVGIGPSGTKEEPSERASAREPFPWVIVIFPGLDWSRL